MVVMHTCIAANTTHACKHDMISQLLLVLFSMFNGINAHDFPKEVVLDDRELLEDL